MEVGMDAVRFPENKSFSHFGATSRRRSRWLRPRWQTPIAGLLALVLAVAPVAFAERTRLKPGWNLFSPEQDVEMGRQVAADAEKQLPMLKDRRVDDYLNRLGRRLAERAPGEKYPYQFKAVNDRSINAFALPGGFLYVNRGTIEAADTEAQLAGVIGHEIGHVALRHGTNQASKAYAAQAPLAILGGVVGSSSIAGVLAQIGAGFAVNSVLLKYSRDAERQSDIIGTQILYDNGYDPRAMAQFFEKLEAEGGGRPPEFFSSHPKPENRVGNINQEISKLGGNRRYQEGSSEFREIQRHLQSLPAPPKASQQPRSGETTGGQVRRPAPASTRAQNYENRILSLRHPDNWRVYGQGDAFTIAPEGGIGQGSDGRSALAYGAMMAVFEPQSGRYSPRLEEATDQLIDSLQNSNPQMRVEREQGRTRAGGEPAMSILLSNESPLGGREINWLVTVQRPEGLVYLVFVAPQSDFREYQRTFENMLSSVRFAR
jgi:Zn-dependent protease with chaperone function